MLYALIIVLIFPFSCSQEEELNAISENVNSRASQDAELTREPYTYKAPLAEAVLSPCGYGFSVGVIFAGSPIVGSYPYEIRDMGGVLVDSGSISHGMNTTWVLSGCTTYQFEFWGSWACSTCSAVQTVTSDGCGGVFVC